MSVQFAIGGAAYSRNRGSASDTCSNSSSFTEASCTAGIGYISDLSNISVNLPSVIFGNFTGLGSITMFIDQYGGAFFDETDGDDGYIDHRSSSLSTSGDVSLTQ